MNTKGRISTALIGESDPDDRFFMKKALARAQMPIRLTFA